MSERYKYSKTLKDLSGKRYKETTIYPKVEKQLGDIYIISQRGDTLDYYAKKYYGDSTDWVIIAQANNLGKGSLNVEPGLQIRIPLNNDGFDNDVDNLNIGL